MPEEWGGLIESLVERNFLCDVIPRQDAGGVKRYEVSNSSGTLKLTEDEIGQLIVHNMPHKQFEQWVQERQQEAN
jgi:hypothetical protein